ncbi:hypothetical protein [Sedimenticola sp.]|uniref:hypothetical protein n=1 Tax=Sedimenticola sp. TaxID=1940285 RepID=UPI003D1326E0
MCDQFYTSMFAFLDHARQRSFSGRTCYAVAEVRTRSQSQDYEVIVTQNSASGLLNGGARAALSNPSIQVTYFSVTSAAPRGNYVQIQQSDQIARVPNRHAEMNVIMYCVANYLLENPGGPASGFCLDTYCRAINPSLNFCPECQFALALLSRPAAQMIGSISELMRDESGRSAPVLFLRGNGRLSPNWAAPWTSYYDDVPNSNFFNQLREAGNLDGEFSVGFDAESSEVVVFKKQDDGTWSNVHRAGGRY